MRPGQNVDALPSTAKHIENHMLDCYGHIAANAAILLAQGFDAHREHGIRVLHGEVCAIQRERDCGLDLGTSRHTPQPEIAFLVLPEFQPGACQILGELRAGDIPVSENPDGQLCGGAFARNIVNSGSILRSHLL
jgi:hypothetical protein